MVLPHFRFVPMGGPPVLAPTSGPSVALLLLVIILFIGTVLFRFIMYRLTTYQGSVP